MGGKGRSPAHLCNSVLPLCCALPPAGADERRLRGRAGGAGGGRVGTSAKAGGQNERAQRPRVREPFLPRSMATDLFSAPVVLRSALPFKASPLEFGAPARSSYPPSEPATQPRPACSHSTDSCWALPGPPARPPAGPPPAPPGKARLRPPPRAPPPPRCPPPAAKQGGRAGGARACLQLPGTQARAQAAAHPARRSRSTQHRPDASRAAKSIRVNKGAESTLGCEKKTEEQWRQAAQ